MRWEKIKSIKKVKCKKRCYDISIEGMHKGFLANGMQVHNSDFTIADAFTTFEDGKEFAKKYPSVVDYSIKLEGQVKGIGQHAAAMVISSEDLNLGDRAYLRKGKDESLIVNWEKEDLEHSGLMKLDVLGLSALTILNEIKRLVKLNSKNDIDFETIPLTDKKVFDEFSKGNNIGVFQFGSLGLRKLCQEIGIDDFNMLVHVNALHRPGTLRSGMTAEFGRRKRKEVEWSHIHPFLEKITGETFGIILYQEQVMKFMYDLGGLPWKTTDTVRKVISKSKGVDQFMKFKQMFIDGCLERKTLDLETASNLWDELASFGSYGFNKSHAAEYSLISYWDQWCKVHYPTEFICACLTYGQDDKKEDFVDEARRLGVDIRPPKYGISDSSKWIIKNESLYAPFLEIKGFGEKISEQILSLEIKDGFFKVGGKKISSKVKATLDEIGVFDDKEVTEEDLKKLNKYFSFSFSKDLGLAFRKILERISEKIVLAKTEDIDFKTVEKDPKYYFGKMTEIKFGYRGKFDSLEKKLGASGLADNLGGVYGNFQDETDFVMLVFDSKFYLKRKFEVEHCGGNFLLVKANHPLRTSSIQALDGWFDQDLLICNLDGFNINLLDKKRFKNNELLKCDSCGLRQEAKAPVLPSMGIYNLMIVGEGPGKDEDAEGIGFTGKAGEDVLWPEFAKYKLNRRMFHITNIVKCYPSKTRTPDKRHIKACSKWLKEEIEKISPIMIFAFGNTSLKFFKNQDSGIMELNGKTEWNDEYGCWICWGIHPASVLYHRENETLFSEAVANFAKKLSYIGL